MAPADSSPAHPALAPLWALLPAHAARCTLPEPFRADPQVPGALEAQHAPALLPAHVPDSQHVLDSHRVPAVLAEHPEELLKAAHQRVCVQLVPASAAAVSATKR